MQFNKSLRLVGLFILILVVITVFTGCGGGTVSEETKIENVITEFFQALSDEDWDKARSYCVYGSLEYRYVTEIEEQWNNNFGVSGAVVNLDFVIDNIDPIIVTGNYAQAHVYYSASVQLLYLGQLYWEELFDGDWWFYLQKVGNNWKLYYDDGEGV